MSKGDKKNLFLIGPMGAGKSSIGKQLAKLTQRDFYDTDEEITKRTGVQIGWIFEAEGEAGFREREKAVIAELVTKHSIILSTGGGTIIMSENRELLNKHGLVIYLDVSLKEQLHRTKRTHTRPLLETKNVEQKLIELNEARRPLYESIADLTYLTDKGSPKKNCHPNYQGYCIMIGQDLLNQPELIRSAVRGKQVMIVTQNPIAKHYLKPLMSALTDLQCDVCFLPDGEQQKTIASWQHVLEQLAKHKHQRDTTLIALGGGVVGDITGFAAATYMRGINYIQIPTTLLAQIDSSIGGKTGINLAAGKNLVGAFHQPIYTFVDIKTLDTLPHRQFIAGFAEMIKVALVRDATFFEWIEQQVQPLLAKDTNTLLRAIHTARHIKQTIVNEDERENGVRTLLNLGHTFAHAIETETNYSEFLHGEAVAIGLVLSATDESIANRVSKLLQKFGLPTKLPNHIKYDKLLAHFELDKKVRNQQWRLVLLKDIGHATIAEVERDALSQRVLSTA